MTTATVSRRDAFRAEARFTPTVSKLDRLRIQLRLKKDPEEQRRVEEQRRLAFVAVSRKAQETKVEQDPAEQLSNARGARRFLRQLRTGIIAATGALIGITVTTAGIVSNDTLVGAILGVVATFVVSLGVEQAKSDVSNFTVLNAGRSKYATDHAASSSHSRIDFIATSS